MTEQQPVLQYFGAPQGFFNILYHRNPDGSLTPLFVAQPTEAHLGEIGQRLVEVVATFTLATPGQASYHANDAMLPAAGGLITLANVARVPGGGGHVVGLAVSTNKKSITPRLRVHFFKANTPTLSADGANWQEKYADVLKRIRFYDLPAMTTATDSANSDMSRTFDRMDGGQGIYMPFVCAEGDRNLYVGLEPLDAFVPDPGQSFTVKIAALLS